MAKKNKPDPLAGLGKALEKAEKVKPESPKAPVKVKKTPQKTHKQPLTLPEDDYLLMKELMTTLERHADYRSVSAPKAIRYALRMVDAQNINIETLSDIMSSDQRVKAQG